MFAVNTFLFPVNAFIRGMQRAFDSLTHSQLNANCEQYFSTENQIKYRQRKKQTCPVSIWVGSFFEWILTIVCFYHFRSWWELCMCLSAAACLCGFYVAFITHTNIYKLTNFTLLMQFSVVSRYFRHVRTRS